MHQNAALPDKKSKNFLGRGHGPLPCPSHTRDGDATPYPTHLGAIGACVLAPSALGVPVAFHLRLEDCNDSSMSGPTDVIS